MMKRRDALKTIGGLAGAAGMARFLPACGNDDEGPTGITTYVYMMMENRSYDHWFGARSLVEGLPGDGLRPGMTNPNLQSQPVELWTPNHTAAQLCDIDPPHGWDAAHRQFNDGAMDGFVTEHQRSHGNDPQAIEPMKYLAREHIPVSWALADRYTSCDRWFCSVMGPTWPNRFYWHTGSSGGIKTNELPNAKLPWASINHRLNDAGVDWAYYYGNIAVASFLDDEVTDGKVHRFAGGTERSFLKDAAAGKLPPVCYIDPSFYYNDDHPPIHPINGQELIAAVYKALAESPQWKNCLLVITYDENGGYYDHVAPPKVTGDAYAADGFDQLGFRVPTLVVGPYVKQGYVSSVQYEHCSALRHLETTFGLEPLNARTAAANDLSDCIDMDRLARGDWARPVALPAIDPTEWEMTGACSGGARVAPAEGDCPIHDWANQYPELHARTDLRGREHEERDAIRAFLAQPSRVRV
ncbi:MAG: alkaline phosphatase family protein [Kofleriaceae bacterium]